MTGTLSAEQLAERTYFWERIRSLFSGCIEIIWQPGAAVALLVAIRYYDVGPSAKSLISASNPIGFLLTPLSLTLFAWSRRPINQLMAALHVAAGGLLLLIPFFHGAAVYVLLVVIAHILLAQYIPMYTELYSRNFTTAQRGNRISMVFLISGAVSVLANLVAGELLDRRLESFHAVLFVGGLCCLFSAGCLLRTPSGPLQRDKVGNPLKNLSLAWKDKLFGWMLSSWMLLGFGNLMTLPLRTEYMANPRFGIDASNQDILLVTGAVPLVCRLLASRLLGRLFDAWNLVHLRILLNLLTFFSVMLFFTTKNLWVMGFSMALMGMAMAGGRIAWSLWVTKLVEPGKTSAYMSVHMFSTGFRGTVAPFVGFTLIANFSARQVGWMGSALILISTLMFLPAVGHMKRRGEVLENTEPEP